MGQRPRQKPKHLPAKLLAIRRSLGLSQSQVGKRLELKVGYERISEWEKGTHEPNLFVLLRYARLAGISTDILIDDEVELKL